MDFLSRFIALVILILFSPLFTTIFILCMVIQGFPIFFEQERVGNEFKVFHIYKFRTMVNNSGKLITELNDSRVTFLGKFLRKSKLDELPQLLNILKGEMRFIGPRPEVLKYFKKKDFHFLKNIKPGISDYASILFRDEEKILERIGGNNPYLKLLPVKLELAEYYSRKKNILLDFRLVMITILSIFSPEFSSKILIVPSLIIDLPDMEEFLKKYIL